MTEVDLSFPFETLVEEVKYLIIADQCDYVTKLCLSHTCTKYSSIISSKWIYYDPWKRFGRAIKECAATGSFQLLRYILSIAAHPPDLVQILKGVISSGKVELLDNFDLKGHAYWGSATILLRPLDIEFDLAVDIIAFYVGKAGRSDIHNWFLTRGFVIKDIPLASGAALRGHLGFLRDKVIKENGRQDTSLILSASVVEYAIRGGNVDILEWFIRIGFLRMGTYGNPFATNLNLVQQLEYLRNIKYPSSVIAIIDFLELHSVISDEETRCLIIETLLDSKFICTDTVKYLDRKYQIFTHSKFVKVVSDVFSSFITSNQLPRFLRLLKHFERPMFGSFLTYRAIFESLSENLDLLEPDFVSAIKVKLSARSLRFKMIPQHNVQNLQQEPTSCLLLEFIKELSRLGSPPPQDLYILEAEEELFSYMNSRLVPRNQFRMWLKVVAYMKELGSFV